MEINRYIIIEIYSDNKGLHITPYSSKKKLATLNNLSKYTLSKKKGIFKHKNKLYLTIIQNPEFIQDKIIIQINDIPHTNN